LFFIKQGEESTEMSVE